MVQRVVVGAAASALAVSALSVAGTGPAAAAAPSDCPTNALCMFTDVDFVGTMAYSVLGDGFPSGVCAVFATNIDNLTSSIMNNTERNVTFYEEPDCTGDSFAMVPFSPKSYVGNEFNDALSAVRI